MTFDNNNPSRAYLANLIRDPVILAAAQKLNVVRRERKVDIVCLVWTPILGFGNGSKRLGA